MGTNIKSATAIITELRDGVVVTEMSTAIHEAIAAVKQHGKEATVTLTVKVAPFKSASGTKVVEPPITITAEVEKKLPKDPPPATLFWVAEDGNPQRNPARQEALSFGVASPTSTATGANP